MSTPIEAKVERIEKLVEQVAARMEQRPADFIIYKGKGALQFSFREGSPVESESKTSGKYVGTKKGALFLTAAPARGPQDYDWTQKIILGMNEHEVSQLLSAMRGAPQSFFHDRGKGTDEEGKDIKKVSITKSDDGTVLFVSVQEVRNGETRKIPSIPISKEEAVGITNYLERAQQRILGFL
jgi:hypothetical protein